jgi:maltose O-acetyltransferase
MVAGEMYLADDAELVADRQACERALRAFNADADEGKREDMLRALLGALGERSYIRPPFFCDYGYNLTLGDDVFMNFNCVALDVVPITIGNRVQMAPAVQLLAADHPLDPAERSSGREFGRPITIEDDVWLGGGVVVLPGVTIGRASVIGAGSVVTKDIPPGVVAVGNPCRVIREIA